ncbi:unannotated protein [freshwater metagenome]|uniref:Unannotated protein n=1 Tax=freshwater metagenome TaxID=449393 RepID=A0A6J7S0L9_9ZZZZ
MRQRRCDVGVDRLVVGGNTAERRCHRLRKAVVNLYVGGAFVVSPAPLSILRYSSVVASPGAGQPAVREQAGIVVLTAGRELPLPVVHRRVGNEAKRLRDDGAIDLQTVAFKRTVAEQRLGSKLAELFRPIAALRRRIAGSEQIAVDREVFRRDRVRLNLLARQQQENLGLLCRLRFVIVLSPAQEAFDYRNFQRLKILLRAVEGQIGVHAVRRVRGRAR